MVTKVIPLVDELKNHIKTDISVDDMKKLVGEAKDSGKYKVININVSDTDYLKSSYSDYGGYILIPRLGMDRWGELHSMIANGILEITPTPSLSPTKKVTPTALKIKR